MRKVCLRNEMFNLVTPLSLLFYYSLRKSSSLTLFDLHPSLSSVSLGIARYHRSSFPHQNKTKKISHLDVRIGILSIDTSLPVREARMEYKNKITRRRGAGTRPRHQTDVHRTTRDPTVRRRQHHHLRVSMRR